METKETMYERCCKVMPPVAGRYTTLGVVKGEGSYLYGEDGKNISTLPAVLPYVIWGTIIQP